jgi:transposase InsO family protein
MPWQEVSAVELRKEFVALASQAGANVRELCRRFGISPGTGYKWLERARCGEPLEDRSRRPLHSPSRSSQAVEREVVALRQAHPAWGARKLAKRLQVLGVEVPAASTVHAILARHGLISAQASEAAHTWQRFEHAQPNDLWQMDFKGHVALDRERCHPLTILDDHSRYAVCLQACADERELTVKARLIAAFQRYGLPARMTMDNGSPWGDDSQSYTRLEVWLMRHGIRVSHSRPYHPQTQGKDERFHRSLNAEVLQGPPFADLGRAQSAFDRWRWIYNTERPHQALGMEVPASRFRPSTRTFVENPPPPEYGLSDAVRKVQDEGRISWKGRAWRVGKAFIGERVAVRPAHDADAYDVYWSRIRIARIELRTRTVITGKRIT